METFYSLVQTIIVLMIVILIANFTLKYLNKYMAGGNRIIKIIEKVAVNKNSYISLVEINGSYFIMSFNENRNEILKELDKKEIEELLDGYKEECVDNFGIQEKIKKIMSNYRNNNNSSSDVDSTDSFS